MLCLLFRLELHSLVPQGFVNAFEWIKMTWHIQNQRQLETLEPKDETPF